MTLKMTVPAPRRRRPLLWAALALPAAGWAALALGAATPLKGLIEQRAGDALGRAVTIGGPVRVFLTPFSMQIAAGQVHVANADWASAPALLDAGLVEARFDMFDLLIGRPRLRTLGLHDAVLDLERRADGGAVNWTPGKAGTLFDPAAISALSAQGTALRYRDRAANTDVRLALNDEGRGAIGLSGAAMIDGRRMTLAGTLRSSRSGPTQFDLDARMAGLSLRLNGVADGPLALGKARLSGTAQGPDFAQLAALGGIALPPMPGYEISARIGHARQGWRFSRIEGRIGGTDLAGRLTLDQRRARPLLVASLTSRQLDARDARHLFSLQDDPDGARLLPDAPLSSEALGRFDAVVDYRADRVTGTGQTPAHLTLKLALLRGMLQLSPASVDLAGGFVSTDLFIDARRDPALVRADLRLSPTPMGNLLHDWGIATAGTTAMVKGRIQLVGRGDTLREAIGTADGRMALIIPGGALRMAQASASSLDMAVLSDAIFQDGGAAQLAGVNCGLIAFTVRNGLASADPILIDTDGHVLTGTGQLDLRDERLDLRLHADGKSFGFFARPTPVQIGGTLADPMLLREERRWLRPGGWFGLPLPDLGSILGFVDPEDVQAPACGPVLRGAPAVAQRER
jgi:uncharacterized protein involved in outer membrane biogenesis